MGVDFQHNIFKGKFDEYKTVLINSKKYWILYLFFITLTFLSTISMKNIFHPKFELIIFFIVSILGVFCILYYFLHNKDIEVYKVAFIIIICFGIICSLIVPISDVSDESEHLTRAEITSRGVIVPHYTGEDIGIDRTYNLTDGELSDELNNVGFETIDSIHFFKSNKERTVFEVIDDTDKINNSLIIVSSAFEQNPFYGYLPQAIGIFIAKLLDLNVIWLMWLGRIFNLLCYACLISLAIKKTPYLKIPLISISCIPIVLYQASSISIDSMIFGLGILTIAYFIYLCKFKEKFIGIKEICIFSGLCLLLGLCKLPYLAFIFLILFVPSQNFKDFRKVLPWLLLSILIVALIGIIWSQYSTPALMHSWRSQYNFVNKTNQINYLLTHPIFIFNFLQEIFTNLITTLYNGVFNFYNGRPGNHYTDNYTLITTMLQLFLVIMLFAYPNNVKFKLKTKFGSLIVLLIVYIGTCFIQLLTWAYVGKLNLGISIRYFIPLLALIPIIVQIDYGTKPNLKFDNYAIIFIIGFMATLILAFVTKYY